MSRFYIKEQVNRPLRTRSGIQIPWVDAGGDMGWLETNDAKLIEELDFAAARGLGGVRVSSFDEVEEQKKRASARQSFVNSNAKPWQGVRLSAPEGPFSKTAAAAPATVDNGLGPAPAPPAAPVAEGQPLEVPKVIPDPKPATSRRPKAVPSDKPAEA